MINWQQYPYDKISHALIAIGVWLIFGVLGYLLFNDVILGGAIGWGYSSGLFYGREQSQAARKYRESGKVPLRMYFPKYWKKDCQWDYYIPTAAVTVAQIGLYYGQSYIL